MKFLYNSFKGKKKQIVKVSIDTATTVKLLTAYDHGKYKKGQTHRYRGGTFNSGDIFFRIPADSIWYVVVEKGSNNNPIQVQARVEVLPADKSIPETVALNAPPPASNGASKAVIEEESEEEVAEVEEVSTEEESEEDH